jgi:polyphosphate glucokinase
MTDLAFGIDIGGSGIKGAPVDLVAGEYADKRTRIPTPRPSTPQAVADVLAGLVDSYHLADDVPIGVAFPAPMQHGVVRSMANLDQSWTGVDLPALVRRATGRHAVAVNDADAAGVGEVRYGAARDVDGVVPQLRVRHQDAVDDHDAESRAADSAREREDLSWDEWAERLQRYFGVVEDLLSPDLIVVGGGVSKHHEKYLPHLHLRAPIVPAQLRNAAGIVGAAALAAGR